MGEARKSQRFCHSSGRVEICLDVLWAGPDTQVIISGGDAHIGAIAVCEGRGVPRCLSMQGHREDGLACEIARLIAHALGNVAVVTAGIHFDSITPCEIDAVLEICRQLAHRFLAAQKHGSKDDYN